MLLALRWLRPTTVPRVVQQERKFVQCPACALPDTELWYAQPAEAAALMKWPTKLTASVFPSHLDAMHLYWMWSNKTLALIAVEQIGETAEDQRRHLIDGEVVEAQE